MSLTGCPSGLHSSQSSRNHGKTGGSDRQHTTPFNQVEDYSARVDNIILAEYVEEHPPFLSRPAMCTLVRNFYQKKDFEVRRSCVLACVQFTRTERRADGEKEGE